MHLSQLTGLQSESQYQLLALFSILIVLSILNFVVCQCEVKGISGRFIPLILECL